MLRKGVSMSEHLELSANAIVSRAHIAYEISKLEPHEINDIFMMIVDNMTDLKGFRLLIENLDINYKRRLENQNA